MDTYAKLGCGNDSVGKDASVPRTHRAKETTIAQKLSSDLLTCVMACTPWVLDTGLATAETPCVKSLEASIYLPLGKMLPLSVLCGIHTFWASSWYAGFFCFAFFFFKPAFTMRACGLLCGFESLPTFLILCEININHKYQSGGAKTRVSAPNLEIF